MDTGLAARADAGRGAITPEQVDLLKRTVARDCDSDELSLFLHVCQRTGLDPFAKQIYAIKRLDRALGREVMTIQTGIDGYRLVADRTGRYAPGREPTFELDKAGRLVSATAYGKKFAGGVWHDVSATARWSEYLQTGRDGKPTKFWARMPYAQLAKCAESLLIRKCCPADLSGLYTHDEMGQADTAAIEVGNPVQASAVAPRSLPAPPAAAAPQRPTPAAPKAAPSAPAAEDDEEGVSEHVGVVRKVFANHSKKSGKPYWTVCLDTANGELRANVFDDAIATDAIAFERGGEPCVARLRASGKWLNLESLMPAEAGEDDSEPDDDAPDAGWGDVG